MVFRCPGSFQMPHYCACHALQESELVRRQAVPRVLVQNAVCADAVAAWAADWYSGIETRVWWALDKGKVAEAFVFAEIVDDKGRKVARIVERERAVLRSEVDGVVTEALFFGEDGGAEAQTVVFEFGLASLQRQSARGFGEEEAVGPVEEGYETSPRIQAQRSQLRKRRQGLVVRRSRGVV